MTTSKVLDTPSNAKISLEKFLGLRLSAVDRYLAVGDTFDNRANDVDRQDGIFLLTFEGGVMIFIDSSPRVTGDTLLIGETVPEATNIEALCHVSCSGNSHWSNLIGKQLAEVWIGQENGSDVALAFFFENNSSSNRRGPDVIILVKDDDLFSSRDPSVLEGLTLDRISS